MFRTAASLATRPLASIFNCILILALALALVGCATKAPHLAKEPASDAAELYAQAKSMAEKANSDAEKNLVVAAYEKAIRAGSPQASCDLAEYYLDGEVPVKAFKAENAEEAVNKVAFSLYLQAAKVGYPPAQYEVSIMYADERGVKRDMAEARAWLLKAGENNYPDAQAKLGYAYSEGCGCGPDCTCGSSCCYGFDKDNAKAVQWYERLAQNGDKDKRAENENRLGSIYEKGFDDKPDYVNAVKWYEKAAANGSDDAVSSLAFLYLRGRGVPHDYEKAASMYEGLVERRGEEQFGYNLGVIYYYAPAGKEQAWRRKEAVRLFMNAAKGESAYAQSALGEAYENGVGVTRNYKEAAKWYGLAADQDFSDAKFFLGDLYRRGFGVKRDYAKALSLFEEAANNDLAWGNRGAAGMYYRGEGVERDYDKALSLYKDAAEKDDQESMFMLGQMYARGEGTEKDSSVAREWYGKAADYPLYEGHYYEPEKVAKNKAMASEALKRLP